MSSFHEGFCMDIAEQLVTSGFHEGFCMEIAEQLVTYPVSTKVVAWKLLSNLSHIRFPRRFLHGNR
jgi:hypothetical protein